MNPVTPSPGRSRRPPVGMAAAIVVSLVTVSQRTQATPEQPSGGKEIFRYGEDRAVALGIGPEDVEDLVDEVRAQRRAGVPAPKDVQHLIDRVKRRPTDPRG